MFRSIRKAFSMVLVIVISVSAVSFPAIAENIRVNITSDDLQYYAEGITEKQAGILTEEASDEIKRLIAERGLVDIEPLLNKYFKRMTKIGSYDDSINTSREVGAMASSDTPAVPVGTTKYTKEYDNSGIFTYRTKSGVYSSIANATIAMFISKAKTVGDILSWVYSAVSGAGPNVQKQASAKTMYSYRYVEEKGWVYYNDWGYDYHPRVTVVSRDTCEHYWGQYVDVNGLARQKTRDFGVVKSESAPHRGNKTWIRNKAKAQWEAGLPHYYEDWQ